MNSLQLLSAPYPRKRNSLLFVPLLVLGLAGCGTMMQGMSEDMIAVKSDNKSCTPFLEESSAGIGTEKRKLSSEKIAAHAEKFLKMEWGQEAGADRGDDPINQYDPINQFLDCVIAPVAPNDFEARLFRGHVVTVLLARYGAFNITGEVGNLIDIDFRAYPEMVEDSATLLTHIEIAQGLLRSASKVARKNPDFADPSTKALRGVPRVLRTYRILGTLTVAIDAERPTYRRASRAVRNIIAAAATRSIGEAKGAFTDALNGVAKVATLKLFRQAYLADAGAAIAAYSAITASGGMSISAQKKELEKLWWQWDLLLSEACEQAAKAANARSHCLPYNPFDAEHEKVFGG